MNQPTNPKVLRAAALQVLAMTAPLETLDYLGEMQDHIRYTRSKAIDVAKIDISASEKAQGAVGEQPKRSYEQVNAINEGPVKQVKQAETIAHAEADTMFKFVMSQNKQLIQAAGQMATDANAKAKMVAGEAAAARQVAESTSSESFKSSPDKKGEVRQAADKAEAAHEETVAALKTVQEAVATIAQILDAIKKGVRAAGGGSGWSRTQRACWVHGAHHGHAQEGGRGGGEAHRRARGRRRATGARCGGGCRAMRARKAMAAATTAMSEMDAKEARETKIHVSD